MSEENLVEESMSEEEVMELMDESRESMSESMIDPAFYDEPIFDGGPTYGQVEELKAQWGEVYATEFEEEVFLWRTLTRREYKEILKLKSADPMYREERMCETCVLWPEGYDFVQMSVGKAGIPSILAEQIMDRSGFTPAGEAKKL